jgi:FtsH-binding integral membrane protein
MKAKAVKTIAILLGLAITAVAVLAWVFVVLVWRVEGRALDYIWATTTSLIFVGFLLDRIRKHQPWKLQVFPVLAGIFLAFTLLLGLPRIEEEHWSLAVLDAAGLIAGGYLLWDIFTQIIHRIICGVWKE